MKVLVVGRGGREHALCEKIASSPLVERVYAAPGNPGMKGCAELLPYTEDEHQRLVEWSKGADRPRCYRTGEAFMEGLADCYREAGIPVLPPAKGRLRSKEQVLCQRADGKVPHSYS